MGIYNDLDYKNWRKYLGDITTDALWITPNTKGKFEIPKRDFLPKKRL